jgi:hypothetical protein
LGIEIIFDLLRDEYAIRWIGGTSLRYVKMDTGQPMPGRYLKQVFGHENLTMPRSRLKEFNERSENLPPAWKDFVRAKLLEFIE